ncbi:MAG: pseudouridine synthase [Bdellovibrionota bacterium]
MSNEAKRYRLDRILANLGYGTRRTVQNLVNSGLVTLDGVVLKKSEQHILLTPDLTDRMQVDGEPLDLLPGITLLMNKPQGYTCSHKDKGELVYDLLPPRWRLREPALSTVGRLDKDTTGLLLITDDGALLRKIVAPKNKIAKRYRFTLDRPMRGDEKDIFAAGTMMLENEKDPLLPANLRVLTPTSGTVDLFEGRYHQVRRMFAATGNHVLELHRESIGGLTIPAELEPGDFKILTEQEIALIFATTENESV